jgi:hypothetical protein
MNLGKVVGAQGAQGEKGEKGEKGDDGEQGIQGEPGKPYIIDVVLNEDGSLKFDEKV